MRNAGIELAVLGNSSMSGVLVFAGVAEFALALGVASCNGDGCGVFCATKALVSGAGAVG
jgi:hypothetical protein